MVTLVGYVRLSTSREALDVDAGFGFGVARVTICEALRIFSTSGGS